MVNSYKEQKIGIPYLSDKSQIAKNQFGATKCPEAFLLRKSGTSFSVIYQGAIDDSPQLESQVREGFLSSAISRTLQGQDVEPAFRRPVGCIIKKGV